MKKPDINIAKYIVMFGLVVGATATMIKEFYIKLKYRKKNRPPGDGLQNEQHYNSSSYGENDEAYSAENIGR